ncbi:PepSY domain-containing protein [Pedobacter sp. SYP-B3415]|uniref:PepSY-associated TM helix domain-containing protein n=1 Tax=Pedobacter sp. SYP-B3415 TaxID=2496641 RepID=UPI00101D0E0A|nr:PepSY-associated TM helix domain-containing protein [Pedobacter sp. SYP-B3415]
MSVATESKRKSPVFALRNLLRRKKKTKKSRFRQITDWLHLWLGLLSGIIVFIISLTGCLFVFQQEINEWLHPEAFFVEAPASGQQPLPLSMLTGNAEAALGGKKKISFITTFRDADRAWHFGTYAAGDPNAWTYFGTLDYYDIVSVNPYSGKVTYIADYKYEFFNVVKMIHWSLLLNNNPGQIIVGVATLIFVVLLITGLIMWWPKKWSKTNRDKSFKIKWKAGFKRLNYDLHNVPGFYAMLVCLVLALTGLVWAFQWFQQAVYVVASGSVTPPAVRAVASDSTQAASTNAFDIAFMAARKAMPDADRIGISPAAGGKEAVIYANGYKGLETYYKSDDLQFDRFTGKLLDRRNYSQKNSGEKLIAMNYDIHVGAILGLPGKILAFFASFIAGSLPITGFIIWWGKRKKKRAGP